MNKKSTSQQIHEAFLVSQQNGMNINRSLQERHSSMERDINRGRNVTMNYLNENDKGFYVPQSEYYRKGLVDGTYLKRRSITEQDRDPYYDLGTEDRAWVDGEMEKRKKRTQQVVNARLTGIDPESNEFAGRRNEADVRSSPDFNPTAPGASDQLRRAQVQDQLGVRGAPQGPRRVTTSEPEEGWDEWNRQAKETQRSDNLVKYGYQPADEFGGGPPAPGYDERKAEFEAERGQQKADHAYKYRLAMSQLERDPKTGYASPKDLASIGAEYDRQSSVFKTQEDRARDKFMQRGSDFKIPDLASTAPIGLSSVGPGPASTNTNTNTGAGGRTNTGAGGGTNTTINRTRTGDQSLGTHTSDWIRDLWGDSLQFGSDLSSGLFYGAETPFDVGPKPGQSIFSNPLGDLGDTSNQRGNQSATGRGTRTPSTVGTNTTNTNPHQWTMPSARNRSAGGTPATVGAPTTGTQNAVRQRSETPAASNRPGTYNASERPPADTQSRLDDRRKKAFQNIRNTTRYA